MQDGLLTILPAVEKSVLRDKKESFRLLRNTQANQKNNTNLMPSLCILSQVNDGMSLTQRHSSEHKNIRKIIILKRGVNS